MKPVIEDLYLTLAEEAVGARIERFPTSEKKLTAREINLCKGAPVSLKKIIRHKESVFLTPFLKFFQAKALQSVHVRPAGVFVAAGDFVIFIN